MAAEASSNTADNADMPVGWSNDYDDMGGDSDWADGFGSGTVLAVRLKLGTPNPLMARLNSYGGGQAIFEPKNKPGELYIWDAEVSEIYRITSPTTLAEVKQLISAGNYSALKTKKVESPSTKEQEANMKEHLAAL
ncbi:hypothetical protein B0I37DRAFT_377751 [Chaetomium sp. MPI-CAGE-AT-0009]|nr:hypothetical protein B0I37DRAFT_377751 [Chaetomium sp. MPI-CAGE-AT-0009]